MKKLTIIIFIFSFAFSFSSEKSNNNATKEFKNFQQNSSQAFGKFEDEFEKEFNQYYENVEKEWNSFKKDVEKVWGEAKLSTREEWVHYSKDKRTYSNINYSEDGAYILLKTKVKSKEKASKNFKKHIKALLEEKDQFTNEALLKYLVDEVELKNSVNHMKKEIKEEFEKVKETNKSKFTKISTIGAEGEEAPKEELEKIRKETEEQNEIYQIRLKLLPNYLQNKAESYAPLAKKYAEKIKLKPEFVLAIIHTESSFNPKARSYIPAYGLMQLVPKFAALEGYEYLYKEKKIIPVKELYDPEKNVEYGSAYLKRLETRYFRKETNLLKKKYYIIAGYNWGPTNMRKIIRKYKFNDLTAEQVYKKLRRIVPKETSNYLEKMLKREKLYKKYFKTI